jgi:hypothetical protein
LLHIMIRAPSKFRVALFIRAAFLLTWLRVRPPYILLIQVRDARGTGTVTGKCYWHRDRGSLSARCQNHRRAARVAGVTPRACPGELHWRGVVDSAAACCTWLRSRNSGTVSALSPTGPTRDIRAGRACPLCGSSVIYNLARPGANGVKPGRVVDSVAASCIPTALVCAL